MKHFEAGFMENRMQSEIREQFNFLRPVPAEEKRFRAEINQPDREKEPDIQFHFLLGWSAPSSADFITPEFANQQPTAEQNAGPDERVSASRR